MNYWINQSVVDAWIKKGGDDAARGGGGGQDRGAAADAPQGLPRTAGHDRMLRRELSVTPSI